MCLLCVIYGGAPNGCVSGEGRAGGMSVKSRARVLVQQLGVDVRRFPSERLEFSRNQLLGHHKIDLVLDVGANEGQYGSQLREFGYKGRLVSFEPLPQAWKVLESRARPDVRWETHQCALGNRRDRVMINVAANGGKSSSVLPMLDRHIEGAPDATYIDAVEVEQYRLDEIELPHLRSTDRALLKVDVQGYEQRVLEGAGDLLDRLVGIQLELSLVPLYEGGALFTEILHLLTPLGFQLEWLAPGFADRTTGQMLQADGLFFRR